MKELQRRCEQMLLMIISQLRAVKLPMTMENRFTILPVTGRIHPVFILLSSKLAELQKFVRWSIHWQQIDLIFGMDSRLFSTSCVIIDPINACIMST